ncbi:PA14 domain-containing protein [Rhodocytophaga aerolata]|uniref:PA14 domain-containing protein n=1 Tax=Rhodocytophaga aerolata TaxID=455078 RepID=A0ABT8RIE2_9BACT|nr:PA14 domain-containing protein [Rhodocytophaga aerolata]MDO1450938.1 PA14 domain-containing protein [Rhodocytophaga aerolata]
MQRSILFRFLPTGLTIPFGIYSFSVVLYYLGTTMFFTPANYLVREVSTTDPHTAITSPWNTTDNPSPFPEDSSPGHTSNATTILPMQGLATCTASGSILREYWAGVSGSTVTAIPVATTPTSTSQLASFEAPTNIADQYGARIRGYLCAPATGNYTFYLASDDNAQLYLSTDDNSLNKRRIAEVTSWTNSREWTKFASQKSATISLTAGQSYYIEALHKESLYGDNLAVGWQTPTSSAITIIPGSVLSPVVLSSACTGNGTILREYWSGITGTSVTAIPVTTTPSTSSTIPSFEAPTNAGDNYGQRIRGYICPPSTGSYTFYIASDDNSELWLSSTDNVASKVKIASVTGYTSARQWTKFASQKSAAIALTAGQKYYIEALHKEGSGGDNLAVGWQTPTSSAITVIPGSFLSPVVPGTGGLQVKVNFQNAATSQVPAGFLKDTGSPYGSRGNGYTYGWVTQNSLSSATHVPWDMSADARNRNRTGISLEQNTLVHMQLVDLVATNANKERGAWEIAVPNGAYQVTGMVGDQPSGSTYDSKHRLNVEAGILIYNFQGSSTKEYEQKTGQFYVVDGRLTINALGGFNTKVNSVYVQSIPATRPMVSAVNPANGATGTALNIGVSASVVVPVVAGKPGGIDNATITPTTVKLFLLNGTTATEVPANVGGTGGGDAINLSPKTVLQANTTYKFVVTDGVKALSGAAFVPFETTFTTGSGNTEPTINAAFDKIPITATKGEQYTSLAIGPDRKLYGLMLNGTIKRFPINTDGTLGTAAIVSTLRTKYGDRSAVGLAFDPAATSSNPVIWVSHATTGVANGQEWDGKLSKLWGAQLENEQLVVTNLPRSTKDHLVNSIAFKPGQPSILYISQGSNSAMGAYDGSWQRDESLLAGAILKLDLSKLPATLPLNAKTTNDLTAINAASSSSYTMVVNGVNYYNPYASTSPLTIYASGVRNAFDLVWHSNGYLYVPTNGSAFGGNTPGSVAGVRRPDGTFYNGPAIPATSQVDKQRDWLFKINPNLRINGKDYQGYFGHPNPLRGEYVLNRGHIDNPKYPSTIAADVNYQPAVFSFEYNISPNGVIEYKSSAFNGVLKGRLLVCRFSNLDDILVLEPGSNGSIVSAVSGYGSPGIPGLSGFTDPLDLVEDTQTGNLYISEFGWNNPGAAQLTLCRVKATTQVANTQVPVEVPILDTTRSPLTGATVSSYPSHVRIAARDMAIPLHRLYVYPNPSNGHATIYFGVSTTQRLALQVFNSLGKLLTTLYEGEAEGCIQYEITSGDFPQENGLYLLKLSTADKEYTSKMIIIR